MLRIMCPTSLLKIPNASKIEKKPQTPQSPASQNPNPKSTQQYSLVEDFQIGCYSKQKCVTLKLEVKYSYDFPTLFLSLNA